ncbi:MAG: putative addiction module antidote protein [Deltaproteobacteria bacterium]|nr:MAG: putative addiction module antidote protein [Deltaproteobacteria bacterium]
MSDLVDFNAFDFIESPDDVCEYLQEVISNENPEVFFCVLEELAKKQGFQAVADLSGINKETLHKELSGEEGPKFITVTKILRALGIELFPQPVSV